MLVPASLGSGESLLLGFIRSHSCILTGRQQRGSKLPLYSYKGTHFVNEDSTLMTSFGPNHLPKATTPDTEGLDFNIGIMGEQKHSAYNRSVPQVY